MKYYFRSHPKQNHKEIFQKKFTTTPRISQIIPFDTSMTWLFHGFGYTNYYLTQQDILDIERIFNQSVNDHNSHLSEKEKQFSGIDLKEMKYKRQYISAINYKGEKLVYLNCFCGEFASKYLKKYLEEIKDRSSCVFRMTINLTTKKYYSFGINGFA